MDNDKKSLPVGVFDSGLGGISVLRRLVKVLPDEDFIFYGDSANAPYGSRTADDILQLTENAANRLLSYGVKAIVIACNTASSAAGRQLREKYKNMPIICIEPALKPAVQEGHGGAVAVLATEATLRLSKFAHLMDLYGKKIDIIKLPLPGLPEFVERGELDSDKLRDFLTEKFAVLKGRNVESAVLGCTHYPFVRPMIQSILGQDVKLYDGADGTARQTRRCLESYGLLNGNGNAHVEWHNSAGNQDEFIKRSKMLFKMKI